jgi:hypothetical protein
MVTRCSRSPLTDARLNRGGDGHQYPQEFEDASSLELGLDLLNDERVSRRVGDPAGATTGWAAGSGIP